MSERIDEYRVRCKRANQLLQRIATSGRCFFAHKGRISRFEVDDRGRVWFIDKYRCRRLYCHGRHALPTRYFSEGGTLRSLCLDLVEYIRTGKPLGRQLGPFPDWICDGDPWGYGADMELVRTRAITLKILPLKQREEVAS